MLGSRLINIVKQNYFIFLLIFLVFCLGFFLRFYNLSSIPNGLYPDETAIGYNAYSILITGKDEYGAKLPLYFRSFDDYKLPIYIYSTVLAIKAFGLNEFAIRFTSAFFGSLTIFALYFLIYELSRRRWLALLTSLFLTFNPWHLFFSRVGYEVNLATSLLVIGALFFIMAINRKNNFWLFLFSIISFLLSLYTYNVTRLISPLLFFALIVIYYERITVASKKLLTVLVLLFLAGTLPFLISFFQLQSQAGFASQQDSLIIGKFTRAEILQTKGYFMFLPSIIKKVFFNYFVLLIWKLFENMISFFSTSFFFTTGADHPHENIAGFGMFYYFDLPFILFGIYQGVKKKLSYLKPFYIWFLLLFLVGSVIVHIPNDDAFGTRTYAIVIPLIVFSAFGFYCLMEKILTLKNKLAKFTLMAIIVIFISYSYIFYLTSYFVRFPIEYAKQWGAEDKYVVQYVKNIANNYDHIIFDEATGITYTNFLFYDKFPPEFHQQQAVYKPNGLVMALAKDGKYEFRHVDWDRELLKPKTLFITSGQFSLPNRIPLATFSYPTQPVAFYYDRKIAQYSTSEAAYKVFESGENK